MYAVIAPDVTSACRTEPPTGSVTEPQSSSFRLFLRHFQALSSPQTFDTLVIHLPTPATQPVCYPAITVTAVLHCQLDYFPDQTKFILANAMLTTLR